MKIITEEKGPFHFLLTLYEQKASIRAISITMDSVFPLKVLVINKSKDTHHKYQ